MMIRKAAAIALLAALALAPAASLRAQTGGRAPGDTITQGYWKYESSILFFGDTDYRCVGPEDVAKFFDGPCKKHTTCTYPTKQVGGGKAKYVGYWTDRHGKRTDVRAEGTYSPKKFELNAHIAGIPLGGKIIATWQSATCPAGAPH